MRNVSTISVSHSEELFFCDLSSENLVNVGGTFTDPGKSKATFKSSTIDASSRVFFGDFVKIVKSKQQLFLPP